MTDPPSRPPGSRRPTPATPEEVDPEFTPVNHLHPWASDLDKVQRYLERRISEEHRRTGARVGTLEDEVAHLRKEHGVMREDLVAIHGRDGRGGALAALGQKLDGLAASQEMAAQAQREAAAAAAEAQKEAAREGGANRRTLLGVFVTLLIAITAGVLVMRDRQSAVEHDVESLRQEQRRTGDQLDRIEGRVVAPPTIPPAHAPPRPAPPATPDE